MVRIIDQNDGNPQPQPPPAEDPQMKEKDRTGTDAAYTAHVKWCVGRLFVLPLSRRVFVDLRENGKSARAYPLTEDLTGNFQRIQVNLDSGDTCIHLPYWSPV